MTMPPSGQWPPPPQGPPQYWGPPPPPPKGGGKTKWVLGGLGILLVVAVTVVATLLVTDSGDQTSQPQSPLPPGASTPKSTDAAARTQPIGLITNEPTCQEWTPIVNALAAAENNGWGDRDPSLPASAWRTDQRDQFRAVGSALRIAADQTAPLARQTPNLMVAVLYEQFIIYANAYADRIPVLEPIDDHLARVTIGATLAINSICDAIAFGSAEARAAAAPAEPATRTNSNNRDPDTAVRLLTSASPVCREIFELVRNLSDATANWRTIDPSIPAANWTPEQKLANDNIVPVMNQFADEISALGDRSNNSTFKDLSIFAAQYRKAFASAIPSYLPADNYLNDVANGAAGVMDEACQAVEAG